MHFRDKVETHALNAQSILGVGNTVGKCQELHRLFLMHRLLGHGMSDKRTFPGSLLRTSPYRGTHLTHESCDSWERRTLPRLKKLMMNLRSHKDIRRFSVSSEPRLHGYLQVSREREREKINQMV